MTKKLTTEEWIEKARQKFGNRFDYTNVSYDGQYKPISIKCKKHGVFEITPKQHLRGCGCPQCGIENKRMTTSEFIAKAEKIHKHKYDYSETQYITNTDKVKIICPKHGYFYPIATNHLCGVGCKKCYLERSSYQQRSNTTEFIEKATKLFGNRYDYSKVNYTISKEKVEIICKKHGSFFVSPNDHLSNKHGCPKCSMSKLEMEIEVVLELENIEYQWQYQPKWLGKQSLDFYLPKYNIAIECQGKQHFEPYKHFGGQVGFNNIVNRDRIKASKCKNEGVILLYYARPMSSFPYEVFTKKEDLINTIKQFSK